MTECLFVLCDAVLHLPVSIGVGLEVSEVLHLGVLPSEEGDTLVDLLGDALELRRVVWAEALIVAVGTASLAHRSVTGRAGEARRERDLLHLLPREMALEEGGEVYIGEGGAYGWRHTVGVLARPIGEWIQSACSKCSARCVRIYSSTEALNSSGKSPVCSSRRAVRISSCRSVMV